MNMPMPTGMEQECLRLWKENPTDRKAFEASTKKSADDNMPGAPDSVKQIFVNMCLQVFDEMQKG